MYLTLLFAIDKRQYE